MSQNGNDSRAALAGVRPTGAGANPDGNQQINGLGAEVGKKKPGVSDIRYAD
jgi:hypothetical protein